MKHSIILAALVLAATAGSVDAMQLPNPTYVMPIDCNAQRALLTVAHDRYEHALREYRHNPDIVNTRRNEIAKLAAELADAIAIYNYACKRSLPSQTKEPE